MALSWCRSTINSSTVSTNLGSRRRSRESVPFGPGWSCCACRFKSRTPASWLCWRRARGTSCRRASGSMAPTSSVLSAVFRGLWVVDGHFLLSRPVSGIARCGCIGGRSVAAAHASGWCHHRDAFSHQGNRDCAGTLARQAELSEPSVRHSTIGREWSARSTISSRLRMEAYALPPDDPAPRAPAGVSDGGIGG